MSRRYKIACAIAAVILAPGGLTVVPAVYCTVKLLRHFHQWRARRRIKRIIIAVGQGRTWNPHIGGQA